MFKPALTPGVLYLGLCAAALACFAAFFALAPKRDAADVLILPETVNRADTLAPQPLALPRIVPYTWRWSDLYVKTARGLARRLEPAERVRTPVSLAWTSTPHAFVQLAMRADFSGEHMFFKASAKAYRVAEAFIGTNYWRVSQDRRVWSPAETFTVEPEYLEAAVRLRTVRGNVRVSAPGNDFVGVIWEFSKTAGFAATDSEIVFSKAFELSPRAPFVRARLINARGEITALSPPWRARPR